MRLKDILDKIKNGTAKYVTSYDGPNRKERRAEAAKARRSFGGAKRTKPKNWNRDKRERRREQKRRRKQRWQ